MKVERERREREKKGERTKGSLLFSIRDDIWMESRVGLTGCRSIWARSLLRGYDFVVLAATNRALPRLSAHVRQTGAFFEHLVPFRGYRVLPSFV